MSTPRLPGERIAGEIATAVLRNIDPDELVARIDVDALLERIDVDTLVGRVDLDALVGRIDLDRLVERLDVEAIARRVPVGELVSTAEIQAAVDNVDLGPALRRAGLAEIVADSVGRSTLDTVRRRVVVVDALAERLTGTLLRQDVDTWPAGPRALVGEETGPLGDLDGSLKGEAGWDVSGHYVGPLGRVAAAALDVVGAVASWSTITSIGVQLLGNVFGLESTGGTTTAVVWGTGLALWLAGWFLLPLEVVGRTPAMSLFGMRVADRDGQAPTFGRLLGRTLAQALCTLPFGAGYLTTLFDRHRRAAHDLLAGTTVVWDWGTREATIASPLGRWVARDDGRQDRTTATTVDDRPGRTAAPRPGGSPGRD